MISFMCSIGNDSPKELGGKRPLMGVSRPPIKEVTYLVLHSRFIVLILIAVHLRLKKYVTAAT